MSGFDFDEQVIRRSATVPVLVDFWAEWCGPCRVIGPVLDRVAASLAGRLELVKINVDQEPALAQRYRVSSIPYVALFSGGKIVDSLVGALPEAEVRRFLEPHLRSPGKDALAQARADLVGGDIEGARQKLSAAVEAEPQLFPARIELAAIEVFGDPSRAVALVERLPADEPSADRAQAIRDLAELFARAQAGVPDDAAPRPAWERYFEAVRAAAARDFTGAVETLIELVRQHRSLDDEGPRRATVALFRVLGDEHPVTQDYRRALTSAMY